MFSGGDSLLFFVSSVPVFMGSEQEADGSLSPELAVVLDVQKNAILTAVNAQIQGLQTNLLQAHSDLAVQIASDLQPDTYVFKKNGNEQQFSFNRKVAKTSGTALKASESGNIPKAKEELNKGISLINSGQKIKLADKSEFGWATVQEYVSDELADDEVDASKFKKAEKRAAVKIKTLQEKKRKTSLKFPRLLRLHPSALPDLAVLLVLFLRLLIIFAPKVDTPTIHSELPTCAFDAASEVTGPISVIPEINLFRQDSNLDCLEPCEFERGVEGSSSNFVQGKLCANFSFWQDTIQASDFVLDIIRNGYKILFRETPLPYSIENRSSARRQHIFVEGAISELMSRGCLREVSEYPQFCNSLRVAVQSSGKLRLILDLSHLNKFVVKKSVKYEDLRTVLQLFSPGMFVFSFDLKSAYHHIDICEEHMKFLSFKWPSVDGAMKFYEFKVLPFGLTSAPYVFTKVMRQLVKFWRGCGLLALMYLDDGIGGNLSRESAKNISVQVRKDLVSAGFTSNDEKSNWEPVQNLVFLGTVLDFETGLISIPEERILKLKSSIDSCLQDNVISARGLASITGQIISMSCAVGNVTRLLTRICYAAIEQRTSWDQLLFVSPEIRNELSFWQSNIDSINGKPMSPKSSAVGDVYSDASDSGFGGYFVQCGQDLVSGTWSDEEMRTSSTLREIFAVKFVLLSLLDQLSGLTVKWFTDNQNVPRIVSSGSS